MNTDTTVTVKLPTRFYFDHVERDLPSGRVVHQGKSQVTVELDLDAYNDLRSDALYYSDASQFDASYRGLSASARATYRKLVAVDPPVAETPSPFTAIGLVYVDTDDEPVTESEVFARGGVLLLDEYRDEDADRGDR